jgi:hypothetical protein
VKHAAGIALCAGILVLVAVFPCFPGMHDALAMPLAMLVHFASWVALLLVPAGFLWMAAERSGQRRTAFAALGLTVLVAAVLIFASIAISFVLATALAIAAGWSLLRLGRRVQGFTAGAHATRSPLALYLVSVPLIVLAALRLVADPLAESARDRAIRNASPLIAEIERYRATRGEYPSALAAVNLDIHPGVIGVHRYEYERAGGAYNLYFETPNFHLGMREIVVYNPLDEQVMTSHRLDILQMTPEQLALDRTRGHNAMRSVGHPHWKTFWFD